MLIAYYREQIVLISMTDSMTFGPDWIRNLSSEGSTGGGLGGGTRYQLVDYRYGREEMLALFDKTLKPPASLPSFKALYSEQSLPPLALLPSPEEERGWQSRPTTLTGPPRGRGGSMDRGTRGGRGRGYQTYNRMQNYEMGWGNGEQPDWSPRKDYNARSSGMDNWRRNRSSEDEDGWRNIGSSRPHEKWMRSTSWRGEGDSEERSGPPERGGRAAWHDINRGPPSRKSWDNEEHLPEWATENPTEGGGTFDSSGAFHGSDDEQLENKPSAREKPLQKSTSQQHITNKSTHPPLTSSKSAVSLSKPEENTDSILEQETKEDNDEHLIENGMVEKVEQSEPNIPKKIDKELMIEQEEKLLNTNGKIPVNNVITNGPIQDTSAINKSDDDFHRLQEDLVLKLVVDEEPPKTTSSTNFEPSVPTAVQPPPNLAPPQDKWYYQDPQGQMQGPFCNMEMAEWYKAGYFSHQLKVRRQCDERFVLLGELIALCGGADPFQSNLRFPVFKSDPSPTKLQEQDLLQLQYIQQFAMKHAQQSSRSTLPETWQQQELAAQRLQMLHQQQVSQQDLPFMQQSSAQTNPLMMMINKMQQANKLPIQVDKPVPPVPTNSLDPLMVQMSNLHSMQGRLASGPFSSPLPQNIPGGLPTEGGLPGLQQSLPITALQGGLPVAGIPGGLDIGPRSHGSVEQLPSNSAENPINSLLKQLKQQQQSQQLDSLWQQNQYPVSPAMQWQPQQPQQDGPPHSMWDMPAAPNSHPPSETLIQTFEKKIEEKELKTKEELSTKEMKKRKEQEEKTAKKEAEEKRKQEQRRQEMEKKVVEEKKKKEEERMRREMEKLKKDAEEKRMRELEEKRRLKEQRKTEEEMRKKSDEVKKLDEEKARRELKEREEFAKKQAESVRAQEQANRSSRVAPWCQPNTQQGMTLQEIQKAEKEKRAQEVALQQQRQQQLQEQFLQQSQEKSGGIPMGWANKPLENRKVKSLAEIQAEEQERLAKEAVQARLMAQQKEKETPVTNPSNIWNNQNLTWASASSNSSSALGGGFWEDVSQKTKPSISKSSSTSTISNTKIQQQQMQQQQQQKQAKPKTKKEEQQIAKSNNGHNEFTTWCHKTLSNISTDVDIPTFITFLRDIESAFDVREYCKEYLGDSPATQQFASNFLEKRRSFKPKSNAHKDDMCSPAPAITPSAQHSTEFQEVKGKNKKNKKSKMYKVDSRILGFNVTSAPDRINVGDRDYGDNS